MFESNGFGLLAFIAVLLSPLAVQPIIWVLEAIL